MIATLLEGERHIGQVGGRASASIARFTRPADTVDYASGDIVTNSTTAAIVEPLRFPVPSCGAGLIRRLILNKTGTSTTNAAFRLHLYLDIPACVSGDNGAWLTNQVPNYIGAIDVLTMKAFSDGAEGVGVPEIGAEVIFALGRGATLYGILESRGAYTPVSSESFELRIEFFPAKARQSRVRVVDNEFDVYADSVDGNDANHGFSIKSPVASIAAAQALISSTKTRLGLKRGSSWREALTIGSSGTPINGVTVGAYGSGAMPELLGADVLQSGDWVKEATATNVYKQTIALDTAASKTNWANFLEDGVLMPHQTSIALCDANPGSYYVADHTAASTTLYIHATGSTDPTSDGKVRTYTRRLWGVGIYGNGAVVDGIRTAFNHHDDGSLVVYGTGGRMIDCQCDYGTKHNWYMGEGATVIRGTSSEAYFGSSTFNLGVVFQTTGTGLGFAVTDHVFQTLVSPTAGSSSSGFYCHTSSGSLGTGTIKARFNGLSIGIAGANVTLNVANTVFSECVSGISATVNLTATDIQSVSSRSNTKLVDVNANSLTIVLTRPKACIANIQGGIIRSNGNTGLTLTLTNPEFYHKSPNAGFPRTHVYVKDGTVTISGGTFDGALAPSSNMTLGFSGGTVAVTSINNIWTTPSNAFILNGTTYANLTDWQAAGYDAGSTSSGSALAACTLP